MNKTAKILLLSLAAFFFFIGLKSYQHTTTYSELADVQTINGTILQLHCPPKGAASLTLSDSAATYNLSVKFRTDYCDDNDSQALLGKEVTMQALQVDGDFYQVYQLTEKDRIMLNPEEVEADQTSATLGLFFLAFLLASLVAYKSRRGSKQ